MKVKHRKGNVITFESCPGAYQNELMLIDIGHGSYLFRGRVIVCDGPNIETIGKPVSISDINTAVHLYSLIEGH